MRAVFNIDPGGGPGYGVIDFYDVGNVVEPCVIITRISDGQTLSSGGWRNGVHDISPERSQLTDDFLRMWFGPNVVDELEPDQDYEIEIPGLGKCPMLMAAISQSNIVDSNGADLAPPPAGAVAMPPDNSILPENVYQGVEPNPDVAPDASFQSPAGVAAFPEEMAAPETRPKRRGCLLASLLVCAIWIFGALWLWHAALSAPPNDKEGITIEIIPRAQDSSIPDDPTEGAKTGG